KPDIAMSPEPSRTIKEPPKEPPAALPPWLPVGAWAEFLNMRKRLRKNPTEYAKKLIIAKLDRLRASGQDPRAVLDQSTANGWQDVFELRRNGNGNNNRDTTAEAARLLGLTEARR